MNATLISEHGCFGGQQRFYSHESRECRTEMRFSVYVPPQAEQREVPVLYYLAGLTCTEETFMIKGGAQRVAAELGMMLVSPDTSPRQDALPRRRRQLGLRLGRGLLCRCDGSAVVAELSNVQLCHARIAGDRESARRRARGSPEASSATRWAAMARLVCALRNPDRYCRSRRSRPCRAHAMPVGTKSLQRLSRQRSRDLRASTMRVNSSPQNPTPVPS